MAYAKLMHNLSALMQGHSIHDWINLLADAAPLLPASAQLPAVRIHHALRAVDALSQVRSISPPAFRHTPSGVNLPALIHVLDRRGFIPSQAPLHQVARSLGQVQQLRTMMGALEHGVPSLPRQTAAPAAAAMPDMGQMTQMAQQIRRTLSGISPEQREQLQAMAQQFLGGTFASS